MMVLQKYKIIMVNPRITIHPKTVIDKKKKTIILLKIIIL